VLITLSFRPGEEIQVFEQMGSRSGERGSLKRDNVVQSLFHARSSEMIQLRRD